MATPVGHALCGLVVGPLFAWRRPLIGPRADLALFAGLSLVPDLDFIPGILAGKHDLYHHAWSHSLGAALLMGLIMALWGRRRRDAWRWGLMGLAVYFAHVLLDAMGQDTSYPYGVPLWWPLSDRYHIADWAFLLDIRRTPLGWAVIWHDIKAVGVEVLLLGPPAALIWWLWPARRQTTPATR